MMDSQLVSSFSVISNITVDISVHESLTLSVIITLRKISKSCVSGSKEMNIKKVTYCQIDSVISQKS